MSSNNGKANIKWSVNAIKEHSNLMEFAAGRRDAIQKKFEEMLLDAASFANRYKSAFVMGDEDKVFVYGAKRDFNEDRLYVVEHCVVFGDDASSELKAGLLAENALRRNAFVNAPSFDQQVLAGVSRSHFMEVLHLIMSNKANCVGEARIAKVFLARYRRGVERILENRGNSEDELVTLSELVVSLKRGRAA